MCVRVGVCVCVCVCVQVDQEGLTLPERSLYLGQDEDSVKVSVSADLYQYARIHPPPVSCFPPYTLLLSHI